jgi:hypothetical protein
MRILSTYIEALSTITRAETISLKDEDILPCDIRSCRQMRYAIKPVVIVFWTKARAYIVSIQCTREGEKIVFKPSLANWRRTMPFATEATPHQGRIASAQEQMNVLMLMMTMAIGSMTIGRLLSHTM